MEIEDLLADHSNFGPVISWSAEPEVKLPFDNLRGETRNSDMVVECTDRHGNYTIAIESKADEPFGGTIAITLADALERNIRNHRSEGIRRVKQLAMTLFKPRCRGQPPLRDLRYQLLTACLGALKKAETERQQRVLVLVHEFATSKTALEKRANNARDLNLFVARLSQGKVREIKNGKIYGPFDVPGEPLLQATPTPRLYISKVVRNFV
jgi:hypothetical protein